MLLNFVTKNGLLLIRGSAWNPQTKSIETRSLTNSADEVIRQLAEDGWLKGEGYRVLYEDSQGNWDEMEHDGERFIGFKPVGAQSISEAYEKVSGKPWHE